MPEYIIISVDCSEIKDIDSLHRVFSKTFGFPDFYGNNMNAWIDCMSSLDEDDGMTSVIIPKNSILIIKLENSKEFIKKTEELFKLIFESVSFVNYRRVEVGESPILSIMTCEYL